MKGALTYGYYTILRMWKKLYYRPIHLIVSFVQPIFWLTIFGYLFGSRFDFGSSSYLSYLLPGVCAMTVLQSSAQSGILYIKDFQTQFFGRYNFVPQSKFTLLFFKIFADYTRVLVQVLLIIVIGFLMGVNDISISGVGLLQLLFSTFLFTFFYASLACLIALKTKTSELMATFVHLFNLPIIFTSTALIPNKNLPGWLESIAAYNPLSYLSDILRESIVSSNFGSANAGYGMFALFVLAVASFIICLLYFNAVQYD